MIIVDIFIVILSFAIPRVVVGYLARLKVLKEGVRRAAVLLALIAGGFPLVLFLDRSGFLYQNLSILSSIYIAYSIQIWRWHFKKRDKLVVQEGASFVQKPVVEIPKPPITFSNRSWLLKTFFDWRILTVSILGNIVLFVVLTFVIQPQSGKYSDVQGALLVIPLLVALLVFLSFGLARILMQEMVVKADRIVFKKPKSFEVLFSDLNGIFVWEEFKKFVFLLKETAVVNQELFIGVDQGIIGNYNHNYDQKKFIEIFKPLRVKPIIIKNSGFASFKNSPLTKAVGAMIVIIGFEKFNLPLDTVFGYSNLTLYTRNEEQKETIYSMLKQLDEKSRVLLI